MKYQLECGLRGFRAYLRFSIIGKRAVCHVLRMQRFGFASCLGHSIPIMSTTGSFSRFAEANFQEIRVHETTQGLMRMISLTAAVRGKLQASVDEGGLNYSEEDATVENAMKAAEYSARVFSSIRSFDLGQRAPTPYELES